MPQQKLDPILEKNRVGFEEQSPYENDEKHLDSLDKQALLNIKKITGTTSNLDKEKIHNHSNFVRFVEILKTLGIKYNRDDWLRLRANNNLHQAISGLAKIEDLSIETYEKIKKDSSLQQAISTLDKIGYLSTETYQQIKESSDLRIAVNHLCKIFCFSEEIYEIVRNKQDFQKSASRMDINGSIAIEILKKLEALSSENYKIIESNKPLQKWMGMLRTNRLMTEENWLKIKDNLILQNSISNLSFIENFSKKDYDLINENENLQSAINNLAFIGSFSKQDYDLIKEDKVLQSAINDVADEYLKKKDGSSWDKLEVEWGKMKENHAKLSPFNKELSKVNEEKSETSGSNHSELSKFMDSANEAKKNYLKTGNKKALSELDQSESFNELKKTEEPTVMKAVKLITSALLAIVALPVGVPLAIYQVINHRGSFLLYNHHSNEQNKAIDICNSVKHVAVCS